MIIIEIDPNTQGGKWLKFCEALFRTGAKLYQPTQLRKKVGEHCLDVLSVNSMTLGYFLIAAKSIQK
jgi:hypothetical protein